MRVLKTSAKYLGRHICRDLFNKVADISLTGLLRVTFLIFKKLGIQTFNSKQFFSLNQCYWHAIFDHDLMSRNDPQNFKYINHP